MNLYEFISFFFLIYKYKYIQIYFLYRHCDTHFIALYNGHTPSGKRLATVCGSKKTELVFKGPNLLLEFNAGQQVPPFENNGFAASLEFIEGASTTMPPPPPRPTPEIPHHHHNVAPNELEWTPSPPKFSPCDKVIIEANGRSGHFDTHGRPFAANCRLIFKGRPTDVVHLSLFNYRLKAQSCRSVIEIIDGNALETSGPIGNNHKKVLHKMCSPIQRQARNQDGYFVQPQTFISSGSQIMIALKRFHSGSSQTSNGQHDEEFIDGAYMFHDGEFDKSNIYHIDKR